MIGAMLPSCTLRLGTRDASRMEGNRERRTKGRGALQFLNCVPFARDSPIERIDLLINYYEAVHTRAGTACLLGKPARVSSFPITRS